MPQAVGLTAELKGAFPDAEVELSESGGGVFEVTVDGRLVFSKKAEDRFPEYQEVPRLVLA